MKILIVDDCAEYKCREILEECKNRSIEVSVEKGINSGLREIFYSGTKYDGIILDMGLPRLDDDIMPKERGGDIILRDLLRKKSNIPVLIFSETQSEWKDKCEFVFEQMTSWNVVQEEKKFYAFLEEIAKEN